MAVPAGQRAQITLADGTKVWLNAQSTLTYSHDFGRNERNVELDGGAYFEVAKNREIPFYVNTETNQVRIVETHFNVCAYRGSNEFTTTLLEGIVDIYAKGSEHSLTRLGGTRFLFSGTESSERSVLLILIISVGKMVYTVLMILLLTCCLVNWRNIIGQSSGESYMFEWNSGSTATVIIQPCERTSGVDISMDGRVTGNRPSSQSRAGLF